MKINLLPVEAHRQSQLNPRLWVGALAVIVVVAGMGYSYWHLDQEVTGKREVLAGLQATYQTLRPIETKTQAVEQARQRLQEAEAAKGFLVQPVLISELMVELTQIIPQDVTIRSITLIEGGTVQLLAQGPTIGSAARLLAQLGKSGQLTDPKLGVISGDGSKFVFDATVRLVSGGVKR